LQRSQQQAGAAQTIRPYEARPAYLAPSMVRVRAAEVRFGEQSRRFSEDMGS
jgi:hypothetical protein